MPIAFAKSQIAHILFYRSPPFFHSLFLLHISLCLSTNGKISLELLVYAAIVVVAVAVVVVVVVVVVEVVVVVVVSLGVRIRLDWPWWWRQRRRHWQKS